MKKPFQILRDFVSTFLLLSLVVWEAWSAPQLVNSYEELEELQKELEKQTDVTTLNFPFEIEAQRKKMEKFIELKKMVCTGEFTDSVIGEQGLQTPSKRKVTKEEQQSCLKSLREAHVRYLKRLHDIRKQYLQHLHEKRIKELDLAHEASVKSLMEPIQEKKTSLKRASHR